ncbi:GerAB/ArcD/ProY family transporter [Bacillus cereus]|uniref:GerAB/ArcD/ProY family transporter n=1 Tax=Bacillus cereus TaxID=1396 RepID=UPI000950C67A|nr:GerAB/ArcD/ProY family transporter [Bacillus cereus]OLR26487.1 hypothetical protein BLD50_06650 [Bacillus cereus]
MNPMVKKKISTSQVTIAISTALIADGFIVNSRSIAQNMQTPDVWISFFLGGLVSLICGYCCAKLAQYYPRQTIFQFVQLLLGKPIGICIGIIYILWYTMVAAYQIRILGEFAQQFLLNRTPLFIVMCLPILVGSYLLQSGIQPMVRFFQLFFPLTIFVIFTILASGFISFQWQYLHPILGDGILPVIHSVPFTFFSYFGYETILIFASFMDKPKQSGTAVLLGVSIPLLLYTLHSFVLVGTLSVEELKVLTWPTMEFAQRIQTWHLELIFFVIWIIQLFTTYVIGHFIAHLGCCYLIKKQKNISLYILMVIAYLLACIPKNLNETLLLGNWISKIGIICSVILPCILLLISFVRRRYLCH